MSAFMGDFIGFTLGNLHSSQLNINRVSNGNRYTENLIPNFTDSTAVIPGGNGTYYWNTAHTQKPFTIDFAFDDLRDEDIRRLKQHFGFSGVKELIFDESSYKKYYVKCSSPPTLKYIPFKDLGDVINYKGEGTANLVAYYPYAISTREISFPTGQTARINNIGDLETPIRIYYTIDNNSKNIDIILNKDLKQIDELTLEGVSQINAIDKYICIDMRTHLIEGLDENYNKTGNLYNKFITAGDFFLIPVGQNNLTSNVDWDSIKFNYVYY